VEWTGKRKFSAPPKNTSLRALLHEGASAEPTVGI
jgi:hypothetical protein